MRNVVRGVGTAGIVRDTAPALLPHTVWSDGRNVRFERNRAYNMGGVSAVLPATVTDLLNGGFVNSPLTDYILYTAAGKVYSWDGVTAHDITRLVGGDYIEDADNLFDIQSFNGFGLLNNGLDIPQMWDPSVGSNDLVNLSNWDTTWRAGVIRPFKSFLIALNIIEDGDLYPHKMRWSSPAEAGAVPASWDESDPTELAGEFSFPDTKYGELVNGLELGNRFYIYKEGAIWVLDQVPGLAVLEANSIVKEIGLRVKRSLVEVPNYQGQQPVHFFAGDDAFYIMDGVRPVPVFEEVFANEIVALRDPDYYATRSFAVVNARFKEVWFCIPESGSEYATLAFCMNYHNGTYSIRELSGATHIQAGFGVNSTAAAGLSDLPFSDDTFFSDGTGFADAVILPAVSAIMEASPGNEQLYYLEIGSLSYDGETPFQSYLEREALACVSTDPRRPESVIVDYDVRKLIDSVIPKLYNGASCIIEVGAQDQEHDPINWSDPIAVTGTQHEYYLSTPVNGRLISFRFTSTGVDPFGLAGFDYKVELLGSY